MELTLKNPNTSLVFFFQTFHLMFANRSLIHYTIVLGCGVASLLTGASVIHTIYKPDLRIPDVEALNHASPSDSKSK